MALIGMLITQSVAKIYMASNLIPAHQNSVLQLKAMVVLLEIKPGIYLLPQIIPLI